MRQLVICAGICAMLFASCKKNDDGIIRVGTLGRWQWDHSFGGFGPTTITPSANTTVVLTLFEDRTYSIEKNGQQALKDSFSLVTVNGTEQLKLKNYAKVDNLQMYPELTVKVEAGKLTLSDNILDGLQHFFK